MKIRILRMQMMMNQEVLGEDEDADIKEDVLWFRFAILKAKILFLEA